MIILTRITLVVERNLRREQASFKPNPPYIDYISNLRMIIEQSNEWNSSTFLFFIDFERVFDMISRNATWNAWVDIGIPQPTIDLIRELYRDTPCKAHFKGKHSDSFNILRGLRQECGLSFTLFVIALDWIF